MKNPIDILRESMCIFSIERSILKLITYEGGLISGSMSCAFRIEYLFKNAKGIQLVICA